jgi:hypothetical protein
VSRWRTKQTAVQAACPGAQGMALPGPAIPLAGVPGDATLERPPRGLGGFLEAIPARARANGRAAGTASYLPPADANWPRTAQQDFALMSMPISLSDEQRRDRCLFINEGPRRAAAAAAATACACS